MTADLAHHGRIATLRRSPISAAAVPQMYGYRMPPMPGIHRGLPSPYLTVVFSLAGPLPIEIPYGDRRWSGHFAVPVGGLHTRPVLLPPAVDSQGRVLPLQRGIQLAINPFAARAIFGMPAAELTGQVLELADIVQGSGDLSERCAEPIDGRAAAAAVTRWVDGRLATADPRPLPAELGRAWQLIVGSGGRCRIGHVAADIGWSRRHLTACLRAEVGLGAKELARVARFQRSRTLLLDANAPLVDVAVTCGYTDQSHLTAEWREFAGCPPGQWRTEESPALTQGSWPVERSRRLSRSA